MARRAGCEIIYSTAASFRDQCLLEGRSLLWPDVEAWKRENLDSLWNAFLGAPDTGAGSFLDKLRKQLAASSDDVHRIAADLAFFYCLFPTSMSAEAKRELIDAIVAFKRNARPPGFLQIAAALERGVGNPGPAYNTYRPFQIGFYLDFFRRLLHNQSVLRDPDRCRAEADDA